MEGDVARLWSGKQAELLHYMLVGLRQSLVSVLSWKFIEQVHPAP